MATNVCGVSRTHWTGRMGWMFSRCSHGAVALGRSLGALRSGGCSTVSGMTETEIVAELGRRIAASAPAGSRVVLFGSRARGAAGAESDYDVLVIEPTVANVAEESVRLRGELDDLRAPIDVIVVGEDVARRRAVVRGTVVERALREGRVLART